MAQHVICRSLSSGRGGGGGGGAAKAARGRHFIRDGGGGRPPQGYAGSGAALNHSLLLFPLLPRNSHTADHLSGHNKGTVHMETATW